MTIHPGYHDIAVGMEFKEVRRGMGRQPRIISVVETDAYAARVKVLDGPGRNRVIQKPRKQLADPAQWKYLGNDAQAARP